MHRWKNSRASHLAILCYGSSDDNSPSGLARKFDGASIFARNAMKSAIGDQIKQRIDASRTYFTKEGPDCEPAVPTKNSESGEKSRVLGFTAIVFSACLSMCVPSSPFSPADSVAGRFWN